VDLMPPWETFGYFDTPTETVFNLASQVPTLIMKANMKRVAFVIDAPIGAQSFQISTRRDFVSVDGININNTRPVFLITNRDFGPLTQVEWWAFANGAMGGDLTVIEIILREWPTQERTDGRVIEEAAAGLVRGHGRDDVG
jgi:hypothetical protein